MSSPVATDRRTFLRRMAGIAGATSLAGAGCRSAASMPGAEGPAPVFQITGITHRKDPIFRHMQATWFTDHQPLITLPMEATYYNRLKDTHGNTNIRDVFVPPWASQFMMIVQMEARWDGQVRDTLMSALSGPNLHVKVAIAVDEDVDIYNAEEVLWAIATRGRADKRTVVIADRPGFYRDEHKDHWGRLGPDATRPLHRAGEFQRNVVPNESAIDLADYL